MNDNKPLNPIKDQKDMTAEERAKSGARPGTPFVKPVEGQIQGQNNSKHEDDSEQRSDGLKKTSEAELLEEKNKKRLEEAGRRQNG